MENNETIIKIYDNFADDIYTQTVEQRDICQKISEEEDKLNPTLTDEQKEILKKINDLEMTKQELVCKNTFVFAYQLATKLLIEGLGYDKNKK